MKIRRTTLAILILLTVLFIVDVRYFGESSTNEPSIHFKSGSSSRFSAAQKWQEFVQPQGEFTSLALKGQQGFIDLRSTDGDEIRIRAMIGADHKDTLERFDVRESIAGSEVSYELSGGRDEGLQEVGLSFVVEVPEGMEVSIEQHFGEVKVNDFVGFLDVETTFSNLEVWGLQGTATIQNSFSTVDLHQIAGPISLENYYSTSIIELLAIDGGYDFDVEVINGSLKHNAGFQLDIGENRVAAHGKWGEGVHPVVIRSSFGTVTVNLDN